MFLCWSKSTSKQIPADTANILPGRCGAAVLARAAASAAFFASNVKTNLLILQFCENLYSELGHISNEELARGLDDAVKLLISWYICSYKCLPWQQKEHKR